MPTTDPITVDPVTGLKTFNTKAAKASKQR